VIFITYVEFLQLEDHVSTRSLWSPGSHPGTWVQSKRIADGDFPHFFLATERKSEDVVEVAGMGIGETWNDDEIKRHLIDILRSGTDYGTRINIERYLEKLGVAGSQGHAGNLLRVVYGEVEVPALLEAIDRTFFFADQPGWMQLKWRGGETIQVIVSVYDFEHDGYVIGTGNIRGCYGADAVVRNHSLPGSPIDYPYGFFPDRRKRDASVRSTDMGTSPGGGNSALPSVGGGDSPQPVTNPGLPELPTEVLLEVRGEPGAGEDRVEPGSGIRNA